MQTLLELVSCGKTTLAQGLDDSLVCLDAVSDVDLCDGVPGCFDGSISATAAVEVGAVGDPT